MKNRIKELRLKNHLTLRRLGKELDMYDSRISQYETGKRQPNIETWQKLADYFNVSVPYLQGFININIPVKILVEEVFLEAKIVVFAFHSLRLKKHVED